ncbi:hypothetical protein CY35_03G073800 [Sphagnum magellanicum]|nr:hypothetical protein CY35_03G073800 [Sphagnum magellanicum]
MRSIKLPEPPGSVTGMPEIFDRGISCVVRRAVIIGNGAAGAENQCIGVVRALGLSGNCTIHHVRRPKGGLNFWLRWLPVPVHKKVNYLLQHVQANWLRVPLSRLLKGNDMEARPSSAERQSPLMSSGAYGLRALALDDRTVPEADAGRIAALAREDVDREGPLLVVASGRDTVSVAAAVKKLAPEATFVIQIQHPRQRIDHFDLIVTPLHDYYALSPMGRQEVPRLLLPWLSPRQPPDKHVVLTIGALHHADASTLRAAASAWQSELAPLAKPLLIVNVGGPTKHCQYGEDLAVELVSALKQVLNTCGSARISFSGRTPAQDAFLHMDSVIKLVLIKIADFKFGDKRVRQPPKSLHLGWPRSQSALRASCMG